jgi:hypothetical protein
VGEAAAEGGAVQGVVEDGAGRADPLLVQLDAERLPAMILGEPGEGDALARAGVQEADGLATDERRGA